MKKHWFIAFGSLLLFCVLCVGATALIAKNRTPAPAPVPDGIRGIDLDGTYDQNDLTLEQVILTEYGNDVAVLQIRGLKDTAVEDAVNAKILQTVKSLLEQAGSVIYADYYVSSNFANVLSLTFYIGGEEKYLGGNLNIDLTTGRQLRVSDLFYEDVDLLSIVRHAFYETLAQQNAWGHEGIASPDEDKLYHLVSKFMADPNPQFYFTPSYVYFSQDDVTSSVKFIEIAEDVAIYEKYLTEESIFSRNDVGFKNLFTCSLGNYEMFDLIEYGYAEENLWYDITLWDYDLMQDNLPEDSHEALEKIKEKTLQKCYDKVEEYKTLAAMNPDKGYILLLKPGYDLLAIQHYHAEGWHTQYAEAVDGYLAGSIYEMPLDVFENTYKDRIVAAYRNDYFVLSGGVYLSGEEDGATITELDEHELVNYKTGHVYTTLDEVFAIDEEYYMTLLRARVVEHLMNWYSQPHTRYEAEALAENIACTLNGAYIHITVPETDLTPIYRLTEFDGAYLTIFPKEEA